jgi:hypothetical protein
MKRNDRYARASRLSARKLCGRNSQHFEGRAAQSPPVGARGRYGRFGGRNAVRRGGDTAGDTTNRGPLGGRSAA